MCGCASSGKNGQGAVKSGQVAGKSGQGAGKSGQGAGQGAKFVSIRRIIRLVINS